MKGDSRVFHYSSGVKEDPLGAYRDGLTVHELMLPLGPLSFLDVGVSKLRTRRICPKKCQVPSLRSPPIFTLIIVGTSPQLLETPMYLTVGSAGMLPQPFAVPRACPLISSPAKTPRKS